MKFVKKKRSYRTVMSKERFKYFYDANAAFKVQRLKSDYGGRDGLMDTGNGTKNQTTI